MAAAVLRCVRPGGLVLIRDYALFDLSHLRFPESKRLGDRLYQRGDGTLARFFHLEEMDALARGAGAEPVEVRAGRCEACAQRQPVRAVIGEVHAVFWFRLSLSSITRRRVMCCASAGAVGMCGCGELQNEGEDAAVLRPLGVAEAADT